mmetsp:Transcript_28424/g.47008  ORF Transcript_28424/g.47008 Transcript_28424/m.47008 type:complete len:249 (+) Transcript_28424:194-940(+)
MWDGRHGWVMNGQTDTGKRIARFSKLERQDGIGNIQYLGIKEGTTVIDSLQVETISKWFNTEFLQQGSLGSSHLLTSSNEWRIIRHLNLTLSNLGGNLKCLEKGRLTRITSGWTLGDNDGNRSQRSDTSWRWSRVGFENFPNFSQITIGKDETDIAAAHGNELFHGGARIFFDKFLEDLAHHGILSHEDFGAAAKSLTSGLKLHGTNIVDFDNETLGVSAQELLHLHEVLGFAFGGKRHDRIELLLLF